MLASALLALIALTLLSLAARHPAGAARDALPRRPDLVRAGGLALLVASWGAASLDIGLELGTAGYLVVLGVAGVTANLVAGASSRAAALLIGLCLAGLLAEALT
jgi:hypothetical protein